MVDTLKIPQLGTSFSKLIYDFQFFAVDDHEMRVAKVRDIQELLILVG